MKNLPLFLCLFFTGSLHAQIFTGDGDWFDTARWDTGVVPGDNVFATVNGNATIASDIAPATGQNPGAIRIADGADGSITVTGGTVSGANGGGGGGGGVFVGLNGGNGTLIVNQGATFRSQGAAMPLQIGDANGGIGFVSVAGEFQNYKFLNLVNGTLEMQPTGVNNKFNSNDQSNIGANGTLHFVIDGADVGTLSRSNATGLQMTIDPAATLQITLDGSFSLNDSWTLMEYTLLTGQFAQGTSFTNAQGYTFSVDYGTGADDSVVLTLTSDALRPKITSFSASPPAISAGGSSTLAWTASNFDTLVLNPGGIDVAALSNTPVSPAATTTYTLTASLGAVDVTEDVTVVVDELPEINSFTGSPLIIAPGSSATLEWDVSGADTVTISPAPGGVGLSGISTVSPAATTTYTLSATNGTGTVMETVEIVVDAIDAALIHRYDAGLAGQTSGVFLDSVGTKNFDITGGNLVTGISSENTILTAAIDRVNRTLTTGGDNGDGFPEGNVTYEVWVLFGLLDERPQVIFDTGANGEGSAILASRDSVRFLHATGGATTIDLEVPIPFVDVIFDFVQISVCVNETTDHVDLYVRGSGGGSTSESADAAVGVPNGRAGLLTWSGFGGGVNGALAGAAGTAPAGTITFQGGIGLLNIYKRPLTEAEVDTAYSRVATSAINDGDTDNDFLPDYWEEFYFKDLDEVAGGNTDGDNLSHEEELAFLTNPTLADTDMDGLNDDAEIDGSPATDPLDPDSDDDFLTDGEEVNGTFPSDPTLVDTDFDTFWDVYEIAAGSDPNLFESQPPGDSIGVPTAAYNAPGNIGVYHNTFPGASALDATFLVCIDFNNKAGGDPELIFEMGGASAGFSLLYEAGNQLVLRATGNGGFTLATVTHTLTPEQIAAGELRVIFTYDILDEFGTSTIELFIDDVSVGSDSQALGGIWHGGNAGFFAVASTSIAGDGANGSLTAGAFASGTINLAKGLTFYSDALFGESGSEIQITAYDIDFLLNQVTLTFDSETGAVYGIWGSPDLVNWGLLKPDINAASTSTMEFADFPADFPAYYFRVQEQN